MEIRLKNLHGCDPTLGPTRISSDWRFGRNEHTVVVPICRKVEKSGSISFGLEKRSAEGFSRRLGRSTVAAENPDGGLDYATGSISH